MDQVKKIYVVGRLSQCLYLMGQNGFIAAVPCSWYKGMIGAFPAFTTKEEAECYLEEVKDEGTDYPILDFDVIMPTQS